VSAALLLFPDFALILLGIALRRWFEESTDFWAGLERLIYYVLFPALLFMANARARIDFAAAAPMLASGVAATVAGMALAWLARPMFQPPAPTFAGGFQCAFRFNSYLGLALIGQLHGDAGLARMSLMLGIAIPLVNVVAICPSLGVPGTSAGSSCAIRSSSAPCRASRSAWPDSICRRPAGRS
jgi:predicted permease